jgi:hypothetical protein
MFAYVSPVVRSVPSILSDVVGVPHPAATTRAEYQLPVGQNLCAKRNLSRLFS